jgi:arsenate reductase (thioredoxin)
MLQRIMLCSRKLFLFCLALNLQVGFPQTLGQKPEVVFVCEHGAAKSIIAAAEFNKLAGERGLPHRAIARGTRPAGTFSRVAVEGLHKDGLREPKGKPQIATECDLKTAERVVTLGCKLPDQVGQMPKPTNWNDISSPSQGYSAARADIARHVQQLVDELSRERSNTKR